MKIIVSFLLCYYGFLHAQVSYNQEFQVNTYIFGDDQSWPTVEEINDGKFIICWDGYDQNRSSYGAFAQMFEYDGSKYGDEFRVNTYNKNWQRFPCISSLDNGKFVICWNSWGQDGSAYGVFGQIFYSDGSMFGKEFQANTYTNSYQQFLCMSRLTENKFVICWNSSGQDSGGCGIYGQLFQGDGVRIGSEFHVNTKIAGEISRPCICKLSENKFVVCWDPDDGNGISGQIFTNDGIKVGTEFHLDNSLDYQHIPSVSGFSSGGFVLCWSGRDQSHNFSIYAQLFYNDGTENGKLFCVNTYTSSIQSLPSVRVLNEENFIVIWHSQGQDGSGLGIYGQLFNKDGSKLGSEFQINSYMNGNQKFPRICGLVDNRFIVCWQSDNQENSGYGIYAKYYLQNPITHVLESFSLLESSHDVTINNISPKLKWYQASSVHVNFPWELEYKIYLDDNNDFIHPQIISEIYDTSCVVDSLVPGTTYWWKVLAKNIAGDSLWSSETNGFFISHDATGIKHQNPNNKSQSFELFANYPNPFNPETTIKYKLPADQSIFQVKVKIYDALGQLIATLINEPQKSGLHTVKWSGKNTSGKTMPSGIYFCVIEAGQFKATQKMLLVK